MRRGFVALTALLLVTLLVQGCTDDGGSEGFGGPPAPLLVALGDSIPLNDPGDCPGCTGFVESYAAEVGADDVNLARGGALTRSIAEQVTSGAVADELADADLVIVSWGGNDLPPYRQGYQPCRVREPRSALEAVDGVAATTTECVDRVTRRLARAVSGALAALDGQAPDAEVAVLAPYDFWLGSPVLEGAPPGSRRAALRVVAYAVRSWRDALCAIAAEADATCIDLYAAFNGADGSRAAGELLAADHTHPSQAGNDLVRDLLIEARLLG